MEGIVHALLLMVLAGEPSRFLSLDPQMQLELLRAMDTCLQDITNIEIISLPQGACLAELSLTMARLRAGPCLVERDPRARVPAFSNLAAAERRALPSLPPSVDSSACCSAVLERLEKMDAVLTTTICKAAAAIKENVLLLTELVPKRSRQSAPSGEIGSSSSSRWRPGIRSPVVPPGVGARGFLCNMKTKGLYGLRGAIVSVDEKRAGVRIDETGKLVPILRANVVYDTDYPVCLQKPFARGPPGLPGYLQELVFFASHPGGLLAADTRSSEFLRANMVFGPDSPEHSQNVDDAYAEGILVDALSGSVELPHVVRNEVACLVCPPTPAASGSGEPPIAHSIFAASAPDLGTCEHPPAGLHT